MDSRKTFLPIRYLVKRITSVIHNSGGIWQVIRNTPEAFRLVWAASRSTAIFGILLTVIASGVPAATSWVAKLIVDAIVNAVNLKMDPIVGLHYIAPYLGLEFALVLANSLVSQLSMLFDRTIQFKLTEHINSLIIKQAIRLDLRFFETPVFYDTLQNARRQADVSGLKIINALLQTLQQVITLSSLVFLLLRFNAWFPLIIILSAIPSFLSQSQYAERVFHTVSRRAPKSRMLNYLEQLLTGNDTAKEIKLFNLGEMLLKRYKSLFAEFYMEDRIIIKKRTIAGIGWGLLSTLTYYGSYVWIILRTVTGYISLGDMTMFQVIFNQSQRAVRSLFDNLNQIYENNMLLDNLLSYLNLKPMLIAPTNGLLPPRTIQKGIEFKNVSFRYPSSEVDVLSNINLHIHPGEKIALVGLNGAGKTTLIKLLTRMYDPTVGQILLDGIDLREYDLVNLHQKFGVIFQDFVRYQFSVRENIGFGQIDAIDDMDRIKSSAECGGANTIIDNLPNGYETILGRRWENGQELSGGQWQKIALSRAFMRKAEVLILDEPTSALDAESEYEIFQRFGELIDGRTALLISHRFSTVRMADQIAVISKGRIIEFGAHAELIKNNGTYSHLFNLQAKGYK